MPERYFTFPVSYYFIYYLIEFRDRGKRGEFSPSKGENKGK
jgi:hypothetical protein